MTTRREWRFRPTLWATVAVVPALAILVGLGVWQLQRLEWKNALIAEMRGRMQAEAIELPDPVEDPAALRFRRVELTGAYLHERELYRVAQPLRNTRGLFVITPMRLVDGREILVNRGWAPLDHRDPATRAASQVDGQVTVEAVVRQGGWKGSDWFQPANQPQTNEWLWMDLDAMAAQAGLENPVTEVYADVAADGDVGAGEFPVAGQTRVNLRNDHMEYALTWFGLAVVLLAIYVLFHLRRPERP